MPPRKIGTKEVRFQSDYLARSSPLKSRFGRVACIFWCVNYRVFSYLETYKCAYVITAAGKAIHFWTPGHYTDVCARMYIRYMGHDHFLFHDIASQSIVRLVAGGLYTPNQVLNVPVETRKSAYKRISKSTLMCPATIIGDRHRESRSAIGSYRFLRPPGPLEVWTYRFIDRWVWDGMTGVNRTEPECGMGPGADGRWETGAREFLSVSVSQVAVYGVFFFSFSLFLSHPLWALGRSKYSNPARLVHICNGTLLCQLE